MSLFQGMGVYHGRVCNLEHHAQMMASRYKIATQGGGWGWRRKIATAGKQADTYSDKLVQVLRCRWCSDSFLDKAAASGEGERAVGCKDKGVL
jgi:hypothetical protein